MTTSIPSGLGTSVGYAPESVVGTATTTAMRWIPHNKASAELKKSTIVSTTTSLISWPVAGRTASSPSGSAR